MLLVPCSCEVYSGEPMQTYSVRCVEVKKNIQNVRERKPTMIDTLLRGEPKRARTTSEQAEGPPLVRAKATGPLFWVTMIGFLELVFLFACSIILGDGMSLLASILLGALSTVVGVCNKWTLRLSRRSQGGAPAGDAVIRYPNGSYLVSKFGYQRAFSDQISRYENQSTDSQDQVHLSTTLMIS